MKFTKTLSTIFTVSSLLITQAVMAEDAAKTEKTEEKASEASGLSQDQKISYSLGVIFAKQLKHDNPELDVDNFNQGFADSFADKPTRLSDDEISNALSAFQEMKKKEMEQREERLKKLAEENKAKGDEFLAENAKKEGVKTTASGLQYKMIKAGNGKKPTAEDAVKVHYRGTLLDGKEFDSSYKRGEPVTFPLQSVIPGWIEGLQLMDEGSKYELYIPAELAYGPGGTEDGIQPNSTLIFEVELLEIINKDEKK